MWTPMDGRTVAALETVDLRCGDHEHRVTNPYGEAVELFWRCDPPVLNLSWQGQGESSGPMNGDREMRSNSADVGARSSSSVP